MSIHIYRSPGQLLVKEQRLPFIKRGLKLPALKPNAKVFARCCDRLRAAKSCYVQHYYDCSYVWCLDGKGCKSESLVKRTAKRDKQRRSIAAKAGWKTRRRPAVSRPQRSTPEK